MEKRTGIWIDHCKAMIVDPQKKNITKIEAETKNLVDRTRQTRFGEQYLNPEKKLEAKRKKVLKDYYNNVINQLDNESELYIFGPASAKIELQKELDNTHKKFTRVTVAVSDNLTDNQIIAKVRSFFKD
jgi:hypothetical protein